MTDTTLPNWVTLTSAQKHPRVWVINTPFDGDRNTLKGVAEQLGGFYNLVEPPKRFKDAKQGWKALIEQKAILPHLQEWPNVLIGRSRDIPFMQAIKEFSGGTTKVVALRSPVSGKVKGSAEEIANTDMLISYHHLDYNDDFPHTRIHATLPHRVTEKTIAGGIAEWREEFSALSAHHPIIALMVGGDIGDRRQLTPKMAKKLGKEVNAVAKAMGGSVIVTTSRRTTPEAAEALVQEITDVPAYCHIYQQSGSQNPYFGILGLADHLIVTADSMSMCCEAISTGKPVHLFMRKKLLEKKHVQIAESLIEQGYARLFTGKPPLETYDYSPVNATLDIAQDIRHMLDQSRQRHAG